MNCHEFRKNHCAFVDDTLPGIEIIRMQRHLSECESCASLDARIKRSLLVFRNLPTIEPSENFSVRLQEKIRNCGQLCTDEFAIDDLGQSRFGTKVMGGLGLVATLLVLGYGVTAFNSTRSATENLVTSPFVGEMRAVASPPASSGSLPSPAPSSSTLSASSSSADDIRDEAVIDYGLIESEALVTSVSAGMAIWPVTLFAEQVSNHLSQQASEGR